MPLGRKRQETSLEVSLSQLRKRMMKGRKEGSDIAGARRNDIFRLVLPLAGATVA